MMCVYGIIIAFPVIGIRLGSISLAVFLTSIQIHS